VCFPSWLFVRTADGNLRFWTCLSTVLLGISFFVRPLLSRSPQSDLGITVQVYNWASVAPQIVADAENEATRIFRATGVAVSWLNCPLSVHQAEASTICIAPCPPNRFAVRINSEMPADLPKTSLGVALSETGIYVTVYYPRVDEYAKLGLASHAQVLGHAIAHEVGHLLLGPASHTGFGIMRGAWTAEDLHSMAMGALLFSRQQAAVIRKAVILRTPVSYENTCQKGGVHFPPSAYPTRQLVDHYGGSER